MIVMNKDGELFDERRKKNDRRNCKRREEDAKAKEAKSVSDRRQAERREQNVNKTK